MRKRLAWCIAATAGLLLSISLCLAAQTAKDTAPEQQPAAPPAEPAEENPAEQKVVQEKPVDIASFFSPALAVQLAEQFSPVKKKQPGFTGPDNMTILTIPTGGMVYLASVNEIKAAANPDGTPATVEQVVFSADHQAGTAPLTVTLVAGDYVVAVRCPARYSGFDGDSVRKTTTDIITGGMRHCYHLYTVRKKVGEYTCFPANFSDETILTESALNTQARQGTYRFPEEQLLQLLADSTGVPEEDRQSVAETLNRLGASFYGEPGSRYLVKLLIQGTEPVVKEWLVTE